MTTLSLSKQVDLLAFLRKSEDALHAINDHGSRVRDDVQKIVDCMSNAGEESDEDLESEMVTSSFALKEAIEAINAVAAELQVISLLPYETAESPSPRATCLGMGWNYLKSSDLMSSPLCPFLASHI